MKKLIIFLLIALFAIALARRHHGHRHHHHHHHVGVRHHHHHHHIRRHHHHHHHGRRHHHHHHHVRRHHHHHVSRRFLKKFFGRKHHHHRRHHRHIRRHHRHHRRHHRHHRHHRKLRRFIRKFRHHRRHVKKLPKRVIQANWKPCASNGDPHYTTFLGRYFDLYGVEGDYILVKRKNFEVQTRIQYGAHWNIRGLNRAVAVRMGKKIVELWGNYYKINGIKNAPLNLGRGRTIQSKGNEMILTNRIGERVIVRYNPVGNGNNKRFSPYAMEVIVHPKSGKKYRGLCVSKHGTGVKPAGLVGYKAKVSLFGKKYIKKRKIVYKKPVWKNKKIKKWAKKKCKKYGLKGKWLKACMFDVKVGGKKSAKEYKKFRKDIKLAKKRCVKRAPKRCIKTCLKSKVKRLGKCRKFLKRRVCILRKDCFRRLYRPNGKPYGKVKKFTRCVKYGYKPVLRKVKKCIKKRVIKKYCAAKQVCIFKNRRGKIVKRALKCVAYKKARRGAKKCLRFRYKFRKVCLKKGGKRGIKTVCVKKGKKCFRKCLKWK